MSQKTPKLISTAVIFDHLNTKKGKKTIYMVYYWLSANVLIPTCPITEECPAQKNTQTNQYSVFFDYFSKQLYKMAF